jgi:TonB family protein
MATRDVILAGMWLALAAVGGRAQPAPEAEAPPAAAAPAPAPAEPAAALASAGERYQRLMAEGRNAEAAAAGLEVVELTRRLAGDNSLELASPLTNLATAQLRNGNLAEAEANYAAAVALLEKGAGFLSARLVNPLVGLGEARLRAGNYALATQAYERALRVNHVNEGFYNLEQAPIRDGLTEGYLGLRDLEKANFHQEAALYVQQRRLGRDNPDLVPALTRLGQWYDRSGQSEEARLTYQTAARIVEKSAGEDTPAMVEPLLAIAETYRQQAMLPPDPDSSQSPETLLPLAGLMLRKALGIVEGQSPPDAAQRGRILVKLGDLYLMWGKPNSAADRYREAWQALSSDPELEARREEYFGQPARIMGPVPPAIVPVPPRDAPPPDPAQLEPGYVVVRFDVDAAGRVGNATIVESEPRNLLEERVQETARRTLFRPRFEAGAPVATTGVVLRHNFRFAPKKLEKSEGPPPDEGDKPLPPPPGGAGLAAQ